MSASPRKEFIYGNRKKKKVRSHVKRVKLQQKKNPVSQEKYEKRLKVDEKKDFSADCAM